MKDNYVLIIGAGDAGRLAIGEINTNSLLKNYVVKGFIDDDKSLRGKIISGSKVIGDIESIPNLVSLHKIDTILIAMPSAEGDTIRNILKICSKLNLEYRIIPGIYDLITGDALEREIRKIEPYDLLKRKSIVVESAQINQIVREKVVMVTGGAGSIGSELCRQICRLFPSRLLILDHEETNTFEIDNELKKDYPEIDTVPIICDIRNKQKLTQIFDFYRPQIIFHAAAYKHVPLMELYPEEAVSTNVIGTNNLIDLCIDYDSQKMIFISTDKAVNPKSIMGTTKSFAEILLKSKKSKLSSVSVRFGNVWGSRGSVVPLFEKQIKLGGPITITHPDMVRYFITIEEAVQLVIQAGSIGDSGDVYMLDMGNPIKIIDLAEYLIVSQGLQVGKDIEVITTNIRPGEKLKEDLSFDSEIMEKTSYEKLYRYHQPDNRFKIEKYLKELEKNISYEKRDKIVEILNQFRSELNEK
jgi:FlaA1/EpsC-like NDP-sugar epimerase